MQNHQNTRPDPVKDAQDLAELAKREMEDARDRMSDAAGKVRDQALNAGGTISALVLDELDRRTAELSEGLRHITQTLRDATGPAGETAGDTGSAPRLVQQTVDLIDEVSIRLQGRSARDLADGVARFGRDNPGTFIVACLATGMLAGRFMIATGSDGAVGRGATAQGAERLGQSDRSEVTSGQWPTGSFDGDDAPSDLDLGPDDLAPALRRTEYDRLVTEGAYDRP